MAKLTFRGGVHPYDGKELSKDKPIKAVLPKGDLVYPLSQHIGAPAKPIVEKGDRVLTGQKIAEAGGFVSAPIYATVSGTVKAIEPRRVVTGDNVMSIIIENDGLYEEVEYPKRKPLEEMSREEIIECVKEAGVVGMGGAGFPCHVKLCPPPTAKAECVILNGVECEPYITSDYRLMLEHADEILVGLDLLMRAAHVERGYIGIEENKPDAIRLLQEKTANRQDIKIVPLKMKYPQGGEKQLVDAVINRQVPAPPAIPVSVGAIVQNVATAYAVYQAVMKHKPLFERYTTVSGLAMGKSANYLVRMGTPFAQLVDLCGGLPEGDNKVLAGGPMMGKAVASLDVPVCKGTNAVTVLSGSDAHRGKVQPCIRCGKCVEVCPMGLEPYLLATLSANDMYDRAEQEQIVSCIACGSCQFTCPSHRPILDNIVIGKGRVMANIKSRNQKK